MNQEIQFCTTTDHVKLAYCKVGQGPPLVKTANLLHHLEHDWSSPIWRPWLEGWSRYHTLYRYDQRGCGLSDWKVLDFSFDRLVDDLETVVDAAGLERFDLFGISQGCSIAVAYAARHPERVNRLLVCGGSLQGSMSGNPTPEEIELAEAGYKLLKLSWGNDDPAYREVYTKFLIRDATPEQFAWLNEMERVCTSPENALELRRTFATGDIRDLAETVRVPTLVLHSKRDLMIPFEKGREMAAHIPGARFVAFDGRNHVLLSTEPAASQFWEEFYRFLGIDAEPLLLSGKDASPADQILLDLSARERDVLRFVAEGLDNTQIAQKLSLSEKTVRNYVSIIYAKLQIHSRGEAIVMARRSGLLMIDPDSWK